MKRILIIGWGNTLRSDDGLGPAVAATLAQRLDPRRVEVISRPALTPELTCHVAGAARVFFIDASAADAPGHVRLTPLATESQAAGDAQTPSHQLDPQSLLRLTAQLWGPPPPACLITAGCASQRWGLKLTPVLQAAAAQIVEMVLRLIGDDQAAPAARGEFPAPRDGESA